MDESDRIENKLEEATPLVGLYIAAASAACTLAMAVDAFHAFRTKRLWFPSKFFSLNATTLTLLAVAMKLSMYIDTDMYKSAIEMQAKYVSISFMSTAMANLMSSLGCMSDKEIVANVVALAILVTTMSANLLFQLFLLHRLLNYVLLVLHTIAVFLMLRLLVKLVSISIMVPTIKKRLEAKYQELHNLVLRDENQRRSKVYDLEREMTKYWIMAETSNPQFMMAHSAVCNTSTSFFFTLGLGTSYILMFLSVGRDLLPESQSSYKSPSVRIPIIQFQSKYKRSTIWIVAIQSTGMLVGMLVPTLRWCAAVTFKCSDWKSFKKGFKIESHWTQILVDYRESLPIPKRNYMKCVHDVKWVALTLFIELQIFNIQLGRIVVGFSILLTSPFFLIFVLIKKAVNWLTSKGTDQESVDLNLNRYVILLEGEPELPVRVLKNMSHEASHMIRTGRKKQPKNLPRLLQKFVNFNGVGLFDSDQIPSLHSEEPPNCWTLPVATLTSIAISLPNIAKHEHNQLLSSVGEGLTLAKLVEKTLDKDPPLLNIRKAADICWNGVLLYKKWLDINLIPTSNTCRNSKEAVQELFTKAEEMITEFKKEERDLIMENPLNWPAKVVAANSMYRITGTILLSYEDDANELFERLSVMIADILAACLTNLPHVITTMCHRNAIEKREKSVRKAFLLEGKTEQIVQLVQRQEWPAMDHDKATSIDHWRSLFLQNHHPPYA